MKIYYTADLAYKIIFFFLIFDFTYSNEKEFSLIRNKLIWKKKETQILSIIN